LIKLSETGDKASQIDCYGMGKLKFINIYKLSSGIVCSFCNALSQEWGLWGTCSRLLDIWPTSLSCSCA